MHQLSILTEYLSQVLISDIRIQIPHEYLKQNQIITHKYVHEIILLLKIIGVPTVVLFGSFSFCVPGGFWYEAAFENIKLK